MHSQPSSPRTNRQIEPTLEVIFLGLFTFITHAPVHAHDVVLYVVLISGQKNGTEVVTK